MSVIQKALFEIERRVPAGILKAGFGNNDYANGGTGGMIRDFNALQTNQGMIPVTLEYRMRQEIIEKRVRVDCNLKGGKQITVDLNGLPQITPDPYNVIYQIPKDRTQNRSITQVLSLTIGQGSVMGTTNMGMQGASPMLDAASSVMASALPIPLVSTAYVQLIGENTILIQDNMALPNSIYLRCFVEADSEFSHVLSTSYQQFCKLVELCTKSYLYNKLILPTDEARIAGGMELGRFREIVDGYADSEELYQTEIHRWARTNHLTDPSSKERHLRMLVGGAH